MEGVLGGEEQDAAGAGGAEPTQTRGAGGDRDGDVEGEKRLAALGLAAVSGEEEEEGPRPRRGFMSPSMKAAGRVKAPSWVSTSGLGGSVLRSG